MASKMRDALVAVKELLDGGIMFHSATRKVHEQVNDALSGPRLNCEVGTVQEQSERFRDYCEAHKDKYAECLYCPLVGETGGHCELAWAQMPYEESEAKKCN